MEEWGRPYRSAIAVKVVAASPEEITAGAAATATSGADGAPSGGSAAPPWWVDLAAVPPLLAATSPPEKHERPSPRFSHRKVVQEAVGSSGEGEGPPSVRQQHSVSIDEDDAAITGREVTMRRGSWLPAPSPSPAKAVVRRVRDQLLQGKWPPHPSVAAAAAAGAPGSLEYLLSDSELLAMCRLCAERKLWASSSLVRVPTPVKLFGDIPHLEVRGSIPAKGSSLCDGTVLNRMATAL